MKIAKIGKLFFHKVQNIAHLLGQKNIGHFWSFILANFLRNLSTKSTISQKIKIAMVGKLQNKFQNIAYLFERKT